MRSLLLTASFLFVLFFGFVFWFSAENNYHNLLLDAHLMRQCSLLSCTFAWILQSHHILSQTAQPTVRSGDVPYQDQAKICFPRRPRIFHSSVSLLSSQQLPKGLPVARIFHSHHIIIIRYWFSSLCSNSLLLCLASFFPTTPRRSACSESP